MVSVEQYETVKEYYKRIRAENGGVWIIFEVSSCKKILNYLKRCNMEEFQLVLDGNVQINALDPSHVMYIHIESFHCGLEPMQFVFNTNEVLSEFKKVEKIVNGFFYNDKTHKFEWTTSEGNVPYPYPVSDVDMLPIPDYSASTISINSQTLLNTCKAINNIEKDSNQRRIRLKTEDYTVYGYNTHSDIDYSLKVYMDTSSQYKMDSTYDSSWLAKLLSLPIVSEELHFMEGFDRKPYAEDIPLVITGSSNLGVTLTFMLAPRIEEDW